MSPHILLVCTGNLCRSPLVEAMLRRELADEGIDAEVSSAGLEALPGVRPDRRLRRVAGELDVDVDEHRSRAVSLRDLRAADLVLTMTNEQAEQVLALDPSAAGRVATLRAASWRAQIVGGRPVPFAEWVSRLVGVVTDSEAMRPDVAFDIPDPMGGPLREYRVMGDEVRSLVQVLVDRWSGR
jgi:protein-tyrosine-phosphatase